MIRVITSRRDKNIVRKNIQENISILNKIICIQEILKIIISLPKKPLTPYHIGDVVNSPLIPDRCASIFANDEKNGKIHHIQCTISTFFIITRHKNTLSKGIF